MYQIYKTLNDFGLKLAVAESCTGGLVSSHIVNMEGISKVYAGGVIAYRPEIKTDLLGVSKEWLADRGPYNHETVQSMVKGVAEEFGADVAVATSGIAPSGKEGILEGDLYVAVIIKHEDEEVIRSKGFSIEPGAPRNEWRALAAEAAIKYLECCVVDIIRYDIEDHF